MSARALQRPPRRQLEADFPDISDNLEAIRNLLHIVWFKVERYPPFPAASSAAAKARRSQNARAKLSMQVERVLPWGHGL